ncbi:MAG: hypothetical protein N3J91_13465 [Verrucomicrobiae bacterium]|nr:hypothetical protein [Verrucomicrobiae bacterium]
MMHALPSCSGLHPRGWNFSLLLAGVLLFWLSAGAGAASAASGDEPAAVRKVVQDWVDANKAQDAEKARKLLTRAAQKHFNPGNRINVGMATVKTETEVGEPQVTEDTARCQTVETLGKARLHTEYSLKKEDGHWRIHALSIMLNEKERALTLDLEQGLTPKFEADPQKVQAFLVQLAQIAAKAAAGNQPAKSGGSRPATPPASRPPPPTEVEAPKPPPAPEPIVPLDFGNRRRPVQLDFVEFTGSGAERGVKVAAKNHANKPLRKLTVKLYFLDSGANPVGEREALLLAAETPLVEKNSEAELEFKNVIIPADARKAIIELRETQFTDGTRWPAQ